jgi:hypothetical protein
MSLLRFNGGDTYQNEIVGTAFASVESGGSRICPFIEAG